MSKEHIPPQGGYRGRSLRVTVQTGDAVLESGNGRIFQQGFHARVLCETCNNVMGAWYGDEFARWTRWGFLFLDALQVTPHPLCPYMRDIHPGLRSRLSTR